MTSRRSARAAGALLVTSAVAKGLFAGRAFDLGISGGFASPLAAELLPQADVVVAFGATLNQWTTRHGELIASRRDRDPGRRRARRDRRAPAGGAGDRRRRGADRPRA